MTSFRHSKIVVLVVEDEALLRMNTVDVVEEAGFEVIEAANAKQAMQALEDRSDIQIILSDIDMPPGMDGMELVALVRDRWPPIEIILVSGQIASADVRLPQRGMFFSKPYRSQELVAAITRMAA
jgi:CheY-like chemotaxis protein